MHKFFPIILSLFITACNLQEPKTEEITVPEETVVTIDEHNSKNSLDWAGTYIGTLPCADCAGIELTLNLSYDGSFSLKEVYLTDELNEFISAGEFIWNKTGNEITLVNENGPIIFKVGENFLQKLDVEGNEIKGDLADKYILNKQ